jgi:hypothetical protein
MALLPAPAQASRSTLIDHVAPWVLFGFSIAIACIGVWVFFHQSTPDEKPLYYFVVAAVILLLRDVQTFTFGGISVRLRDLEQKSQQALEAAEDAKVQSAPVQMQLAATPASALEPAKGKRQIPVSPKVFAKSAGMDEDGDPNAGRFGGSEESNGRKLSATVQRIDNTEYFSIDLEVRSIAGAKKLEGRVLFYLHHTFDRSVIATLARDGIARLDGIEAYGAFTVGAVADEGETMLELNLARLPRAPDDFKNR